MEERHFGFTADPFSLTLDPAIFYRSRQHWMAESFLEYALESQGVFSLLTGEIGCGKSLLVSRLLNKLGDGVMVGLVNRSHGRLQSIHELVASSLGIEHRGESASALYETLATSFQREYANGRRTLLVIDEAQNLPVEILEELRLLSNVNSSKNFLQILLVGQPELRPKLKRPELLQIAQRISAQFHLSPLKIFETHAYIRFRLQAVGGNTSLFTDDAMDWVHAHTGGVPRLINQLCHYALAQAHVTERTRVDTDLMMKVPEEFCGGFALSFGTSVDRQGCDPATIPAPASRHPHPRLRIPSVRVPGVRIPRLRVPIRPAIRPISLAAAVALTATGIAWWQLHEPHATAAAASPAGTLENSQVFRPALAPVPGPLAAAPAAPTVAPAVAPPATPSVAPVLASAITVPTASQVHVSPHSERVPAIALMATPPTAAAIPAATPHGTWYLNRAIDRLNAGDPAGAERLMSQASAAGARAGDLADLRAGIDAQRLELRLVSASDQIKADIASGSLLDPVADNAESHYQEMLAASATDPLTLRARRELHAALLAHAQDAIEKAQSDSAQRLLAAAEKLGGSAEFAPAQEQLREELNRTTQRAAGAVPTALAGRLGNTPSAEPQ